MTGPVTISKSGVLKTAEPGDYQQRLPAARLASAPLPCHRQPFQRRSGQAPSEKDLQDWARMKTTFVPLHLTSFHYKLTLRVVMMRFRPDMTETPAFRLLI